MNLFKDYNLNTFKLQKPPADSSMQTFKELQDLNKIPINRSFVEEKDDIVGSFKKVTENAGLPFPEEEVTKLQDDSTVAIKKLKNYYNRPRPHVLAGSMGMKLDNVQLNSMKTLKKQIHKDLTQQQILMGKLLIQMLLTYLKIKTSLILI